VLNQKGGATTKKNISGGVCAKYYCRPGYESETIQSVWQGIAEGGVKAGKKDRMKGGQKTTQPRA